MKLRTLVVAVLLAALPALAQLAPPNAQGVTMGHMHLYVKDIPAQTHFWVDIMGGKAVHNEKLSMVAFPGVFLIFTQADPDGPPAGSIVDHFGFVVKDMPGSIAKWKANNLKVEQTGTNPNQSYVTAPDGIRLEVFGDPNLPVPVQMNHIHFFPPKDDIRAMQDWYAKAFGAVIGRRDSVARPGNWIETVDLPGVDLSIGGSEIRRSPTKGRAIDHIGFEVKNLDAFAKKLEAQGITLDEKPRASQNSTRLKVAFLTDPWGTRIELTEGLAPKP
jgi:catechol 2,3-dioxygenase-like lactoylglutathione lyase family enzyme